MIIFSSLLLFLLLMPPLYFPLLVLPLHGILVIRIANLPLFPSWTVLFNVGSMNTFALEMLIETSDIFLLNGIHLISLWLPECGSPLSIQRLLLFAADFFGTNTGTQLIKPNPSLTPLRAILSPNALSALARILSLTGMSSVEILEYYCLSAQNPP